MVTVPTVLLSYPFLFQKKFVCKNVVDFQVYPTLLQIGDGVNLVFLTKLHLVSGFKFSFDALKILL